MMEGKKGFLYAPWRDEYIRGTAGKSESCPFCSALREVEEGRELKFPVVYVAKHSFVVMNTYPYNSGHTLVLPKKHAGEFDSLTEDEYFDLARTVRIAVDATSMALQPSGFNVGINMGKSGGGGIPSHLHIHVVPRWSGDTNFMETIANEHVVSTDVNKDYRLLVDAFAQMVQEMGSE